MIRLDLLSAAVFAVIPVTYLFGRRSIAPPAAAAAAPSALEALLDPTLQAALPGLVARRPAADGRAYGQH